MGSVRPADSAARWWMDLRWIRWRLDVLRGSGTHGHRAQKATWLYAVGVPLPSLVWGKSTNKVRLNDGYHSAEERRRAQRTGMCQQLSKRERKLTPEAFRDVLLAMVSAKNTA